jgi:high affinity Mn2+ porin
MISFSAIYQPIVNPAYNQDRGPVHIFSGRIHVAF